MSDRLNTNQPELTLSDSKPGKLGLLFRYTVYSLGLAITLMVMYQLFFMVQITAGVSNEKPSAEHVATVEIINASGIAQISQQVTEKLEEAEQSRIEIIVVKAEKLEYKNMAKSLVISRDEDTELAEFVARAMGLEESEVVYRSSRENDMSPSVTLVLGEDIEQVLNPAKPNKES